MYSPLRYILVFLCIFLIFPFSLSAEGLAPPKLGQVMKENEKIQRIQRVQTRFKKATLSIPEIPVDILSYQTILAGKSITLTKYNNIDLWVQEIDLKKWWRLSSILTLGGYDETNGEPLFEKKKLSEVENTLSIKPFSIINGQFFDPKRSLTPLSFGIKEDGIVRTAGADNRNEPKNILILEKEKAKIVPYSWENLRDAPGYMAMVNLSLDIPHYKNESIGRTYICLKNPDANNESSSVLIFTAISMTEPAIENEILRWGCTHNSASKLDSSGSARLLVHGEQIYGYSHNGTPDYRRIPHSIAVYDGE